MKNTISYEDDAANLIIDDSAGLIELTNPGSLDAIDKESNEIDELITVSTALESMNAILSQAYNSGEMTTHGAKAIDVALESICNKYSIVKPITFVMENMQGKQSRRDTIKTAMEGISDMVVNIVNRIMYWIKKIFIIIYDDIENAIRGANGVIRRVKIIHDSAIRAQAIKSNAATTGSITKGALTSFFNKAGTELSFDEIKKSYISYNSELNENFSSHLLHRSITNAEMTIESSLKRIGVENFDEAASLEASNNAIMYLKREVFSKFKETNSVNDNETLSYPLPFGNAEIEVILGKTDDKYSNISTTLYAPEKHNCAKLSVLTPGQVIELCKTIESQMTSGIYRDYKKIKSQINEAGKIVSNTCDMIIKTKREANTGTIPSLHFLKAITASLIELTKTTYRYNGHTARSLIMYCDASLSNWK